MFRRMSLLLALLVLTAGCIPAAMPAQPAPAGAPLPFQLALLHTNDTWGYLLPCG